LLGKSVLDGDVFPFDPTKLAEFLPECLQKPCHTRSSAWIQETDAEYSRLLRLGRHAKRKEQSAKGKSNKLLAHVFFSSGFLRYALCAMPSAI
jgi:hypothetical protein